MADNATRIQRRRAAPRSAAARLAALLAALPAATASATTLVRVALLCPMCDHAFEATVVRLADDRGGVDRDLFARSLDAVDVAHRLATCTRCAYSGYPDDFDPRHRSDRALREQVVTRRILKSPTPLATSMPADDVPPSTRYALAAQVYDLRPASHEARAWLHLRWAWLLREQGAHLPPTRDQLDAMLVLSGRLPEDRPAENQAERELRAVTGVLADLQSGCVAARLAPDVCIAAALVLRRHGENRAALDLLATRADDPHVAGFARALRPGIDAEQAQLARARQFLELAVQAGQVQPRNLPTANYLLAELCRRGDDWPAARKWYVAALAMPELDPKLRDWARAALADGDAAAPVNSP